MYITIDRFIKAQEFDYDIDLREIRNDKRIMHLMCYIFIIFKGLEEISTSLYYGIENLDEARYYLGKEILNNWLIAISTELLKLDIDDSLKIFRFIDLMKLKSCITLFELVSDNDIFSRVLDKYFNGERDKLTLTMCKIYK